MDFILPLEPVPDSPLWRASLNNLDYRTSTVKRLCKVAISKAEALQDLLVMVESVEAELLSSLLALAQAAEGSDGGAGGIADFRDWKAKERKDERDRLDQLVTAQLKNMRWDIKSRGAGGGSSLSKFEETSKHHYSSLGRYLVPQPSLSPAQLELLDAKKAIEEAEYDVKRYTAHSHFLWSAPPLSPSILETTICLYTWLNGLLPEDLLQDTTSNVDSSPRQEERPAFRSSQSDTPTPMMTSHSDSGHTASPNGHQRSLSHKGSLPAVIARLSQQSSASSIPTQSLPVPQKLKNQVRKHLTRLANRKDALEGAWAERELILRGLEQLVEDKSEVARAAESSWEGPAAHHLPRPSIDSRPSFDGRERGDSMSAPGGPIGFIKEKRQKGVGSRIKGMISSASLHSNLSGKAGPQMSGAASSRDLQRMSLQLPPSSSNNKTDGPEPSRSPMRHSIQAVPPRQEGYASPFLPLIHPDSPYSPNVLDGEALSPPLNFGTQEISPKARATGTFRDLQTDSGTDIMEEEMQRELAGRKKEGLLWSSGNWEDVTAGNSKAAERKDRAKWEKFWVVLAASRIQEYRDGLQGRPEAPSQTIDLKIGATAREGRDTDRRWTFEVVTPTNGKRVYQATSATEMKAWIYAISNAVESSLNGTATVRTFDVSKLQGEGGYDEHGSPVRDVRAGSGVGLGLPMPPPREIRAVRDLSSPAAARAGVGAGRGLSAPPPTAVSQAAPSATTVAGGSRNWARPLGQRTSLKTAIREKRNSLGYGNVADALGFGEAFQNQPGRSKRSSLLGSRKSSTSSSDLVIVNRTSSIGDESTGSRGPSPIGFRDGVPAWYTMHLEEDLAVIGEDQTRRPSETTVESAAFKPSHDSVNSNPPSENLVVPGSADMSMLQKIANLPSNQYCADCYRPLNLENSQRWATISIQQKPVCAFLCIRCAGVHRSLGTHISKIRSPDLDRWSVDAILCARSWGNARTNGVFERLKPNGMRPPDDSLRTLKDWIEGKYVHGVWLNDEDRAYYLGIQEDGGFAL